jgi:hypothetical protein
MIKGYQVGINSFTKNSDNCMKFLGHDNILLTNMCIHMFKIYGLYITGMHSNK